MFKTTRFHQFFWIILVTFSLFSEAVAYDPNDVTSQLQHKPEALEGVGIDEHLGQQLDLGLQFRDDFGQPVTLGRYFDNQKPVLLTMVYYKCPGLCNYHLNGVTEAFKKMQWTAGVDFEVIAVSMDPSEDHTVAAPKKQNYISEYGRSEAAQGWHFLTGNQENVQKLADQLGFKYRWIEEEQQFSHASAAMIITPGGQISRYLQGIEFLPSTLKLALLEASDGKIGSIVDQVLMFCFQFDPKKSKYTIYAWNLMRIGGVVILVLLAVFLLPLWLRERRRASGVKE